jgi:hypothetical protein
VIDHYDHDYIRTAVHSAFLEVFKNDSHLLEVGANERSITHRFAVYLERFFPEYHVDCEYNRNGIEAKRLKVFKKKIDSDDEDGVTVFPDIIVHI